MVETFILNTDPLDSRELFEQLLEQVDDTRKEKILKLRTFTKQKQSLGAGLLIKKICWGYSFSKQKRQA